MSPFEQEALEFLEQFRKELGVKDAEEKYQQRGDGLPKFSFAAFDTQLIPVVQQLDPGEQNKRKTTVPLVEGDFEGDYYGLDEEFWDIVVDCPFTFTVVWVELDGTHTDDNTAIAYGGQGEGASFISFDEGGTDIAVGPDIFRYHCSQSVPALGYLQLQTGDWLDSDLVNGSIHYKVHYTRP